MLKKSLCYTASGRNRSREVVPDDRNHRVKVGKVEDFVGFVTFLKSLKETEKECLEEECQIW